MMVAILCIVCAIFLIGLYAVYIWYKSRKVWLESKQISLKLVIDDVAKLKATMDERMQANKYLFDDHNESIADLWQKVAALEQKSNNRGRKPRQKQS